MSTIQLINTAILTSRNDEISNNLEEEMKALAQSPVMSSLQVAINDFSKKQKVPHEQAATQIVKTIKELDSLWEQYLILEGSDRLKNHLSSNPAEPAKPTD